MSDGYETGRRGGHDTAGGTTALLTGPGREGSAASAPKNDEAPCDPQPAGGGGWGGGSWGPWGVPDTWAPPPPPPIRPHPLRGLAVVALAAVLVVTGLGVGLAIGATTARTSTPQGSSTASSASTSVSAIGAASASHLAAKVDPGLVDVDTVLGYQEGSAAGTGIVLTSSGEVLTNNHVVEGATSVSVTDIGNGRTYTATVVGTDATDDVAVLKLKGASGLATVDLASSSNLKVGESVLAIGNAGGVGGTPSFSSGKVTELDQSITASDEISGTPEHLNGLVETDATLEPGDSGGPLVDSSGKVVAIDTAASTGFQFQSGSSQAYAIPIGEALSIAKQIEAGDASSTVHVGSTAFLGVEVEQAASSGAEVIAVEPGTPAEQAGLTAGDVIDSLNGQAVDSPSALADVIETLHPGDRVQLGWMTASGQQQTAEAQLAAGPTA